jgi:outer membrane protein assembly factor BamD (BamD/ComL family)
MSHLKILLFTLVTLFTITSCSNPKKKLNDNISTLEKELYVSQSLDKSKGENLINLYAEFAKQFPEDTASANYLYKAAEISMNLQLGVKAIGYYDDLLSAYPNYSKKAECIFLKAFIYENQLNNLEEAKKYYTQFLDEFPTHQLAKDAEASLKYLGKSAEELVEMFQQINEE